MLFKCADYVMVENGFVCLPFICLSFACLLGFWLFETDPQVAQAGVKLDPDLPTSTS